MTIFAENTEGMHNLFRLSSMSSLEGYYYKPRADRELLQRYASGLIATTGCPSGEIQTRLRLGQYDEARRSAAEFQEIFGKDNFFLELMDHDIAIEKRVRDDLLQLYIAGEHTEPASGDYFESDNPYPGQALGADSPRQRRGRGPRRACRAPRVHDGRVAAPDGHEARAAAAEAGRAGRGARCAPGRDRRARQRQAVRRDARAHVLHGAVVPLLRRPGRQDRRRGHADRQARHLQLHAVRAAGRGGGHHAVELAAAARPRGSWRRRWPRATRWSSSLRSSPRRRCWSSWSSWRRPAFRPASSTS